MKPKKERMFITIDKDIADLLKPLDRKKSTAINTALRYMMKKGLLQEIVDYLRGEESLLERLDRLEQQKERADKEKKPTKKDAKSLLDGIDD